LLVTSDCFISAYLAIELQSLCFYALATLNKKSEFCVESGLKYFVLGSFTSGLLLFGFSFFYNAFGTINFESFEHLFSQVYSLSSFCGCFFFLAAMLFKLGAFPFHS
jgi:NADH:ubiquinone oxidoreductase subunit 2 (subunit N)